MTDFEPAQIELAARAWFSAMQRIWVKRNPDVPFPGGGYEQLDPTSRRLFHKAIESALKAGTPENLRSYLERQHTPEGNP